MSMDALSRFYATSGLTCRCLLKAMSWKVLSAIPFHTRLSMQNGMHQGSDAYRTTSASPSCAEGNQ